MEIKECKKCNVSKPLSDFRKRKDTKSGYGNNCKDCEAIINKIYRDNNQEKIKKLRINNNTKNKEYFKKRYNENKDDFSEYNKKRYSENKNEILLYNKKYRTTNKEKIKQRQKNWYKNNKAKILIKQNKNEKIRIQTDKLFKLKRRIKSIIYNSLRNKNIRKTKKTNEILGCTSIFFKQYLESLWKHWMNWENYGNPKDEIFEMDKTWDIDHIIPTSSANTEEEIILLNHYSNFQPLCSYNNRWIKKDKI